MMKKGEERIEENLKGIEILAMILIIDDAGERGEIAKDNKILTHCYSND